VRQINIDANNAAYTKCALRDPVSGLTHLLGVLLSVIGMVLLLFVSSSVRDMVAVIIYGASLIMLYSASSLYHLLPVSPRIVQRLRLLDHLMIYILIAGTYTPICLLALPGSWGISMLAIIWTLAAAGMATQGLWFKAPRWLSTLIYILMGWLVIVATIPLYRAVGWAGVLWLLGGGILYSVGAAVYAVKWPNFANPWFGFHELFHLFVMAGSFCHYWMIARYVLS